MSISEKTKATFNKIEQNKAHNDLDRQTATISAFSSGNISKYEFSNGKDVLAEKDFVEKAAALKRFERSPLGKVFEKEANVIKKQTEVVNKKEHKKINSKKQ